MFGWTLFQPIECRYWRHWLLNWWDVYEASVLILRFKSKNLYKEKPFVRIRFATKIITWLDQGLSLNHKTNNSARRKISWSASSYLYTLISVFSWTLFKLCEVLHIELLSKKKDAGSTYMHVLLQRAMIIEYSSYLTDVNIYRPRLATTVILLSWTIILVPINFYNIITISH